MKELKLLNLLTGVIQKLTQKLSKKAIILLIASIVVLIYILSGFYNPLTITEYTYSSSKIPRGFDGFIWTQRKCFCLW